MRKYLIILFTAILAMTLSAGIMLAQEGDADEETPAEEVQTEEARSEGGEDEAMGEAAGEEVEMRHYIVSARYTPTGV